MVGKVARILYRGEDGYTILRLVLDRDEPSSTPQHENSIVVCGDLCLGGIQAGEVVQLSGDFISHPKYGRQFRAAARHRLGTDADEAVRVLESGLIKGVGPVMAKRIASGLGPSLAGLFRGEERSLQQLQGVKGIGPSTYSTIRGSIEEFSLHNQTIPFCTAHGIPRSVALSLIKRHGPAVEKELRRSPYLLVQQHDVGFREADKIAGNLVRHDEDAQRRLYASESRLLCAAEHCLTASAASEGHCFMDGSTLVASVHSLLASSSTLPCPGAGVIRTRLEHFIHEKKLVALRWGQPACGAGQDSILDKETAVYTASMYNEELGLAEAVWGRLTQLTTGGGHVPTEDLEAFLGTDEAKSLGAEQRAALLMSAEGRRLMVLTGGPGTGKTRTIRAMVQLWKQCGKEVMLACPTARGAAILHEVTGMEATTVHRMLSYNPNDDKFGHSFADKLQADVVVIDEASMLDVHLALRVMEALPLRCTLVIVGDADQLPSIGPGQVLRDVLDCSELVPNAALTEVFRFGGACDIARNAQLIQKGVMPVAMDYLLPDDLADHHDELGCKLVLARDGREAVDVITRTVLPWLERVGYDTKRRVQVLTPMKSKDAGTVNLNREMQAIINQGPGYAHEPLRQGDRVIHLRNDCNDEGEVYVVNGDVGHVVSVRKEEPKFVVHYPGREAVHYSTSDVDVKVTLAYALTVHKAQGSEHDVIVLALLPDHGRMLYRHLLYTAMSRAKRLLVIVGALKAVRACVDNDKQQRRQTSLGRLIRRVAEGQEQEVVEVADQFVADG